VRQANETMDKICTWAFHRKIKFNTNKTQACIFHSRARMKGARLIFDNIEIPICNYIKVLGITLDRDLTFIKHINETTNKLVNIIPRIKNCANANFGPSAQALKLVYNSLAVPVLTFGCEIWGEALARKSCRDKLLKAHKGFSNIITRGFKSTPYDTSFLLARTLPINLVVEANWIC